MYRADRLVEMACSSFSFKQAYSAAEERHSRNAVAKSFADISSLTIKASFNENANFDLSFILTHFSYGTS
ncbi:MAG: hypothetical protein Q7T76_16890 [Ferruginibacter sp.]|nr:hypothetical protein [Ferruginibacter sp.]